ncbi:MULTISPECIES: sarcosine oxidase gamma subunit [unclassified Novosphingobium]|uniref:sarcosine oxidase gamma subunit n=1 Tax=unclassified Novosphingobium TaxID=2644732 RepID=UPI0025EDF8CC|nr:MULTISPECIES: sarcosine oxidase gamma subunit [unclassified Novosphingobium]HQV01975.1 sarcosine oxidase gamma subunit [Novosphingobium sp.]
MTDVTIEQLGRAPLHMLELWGDPKAAAKRIAKALGHDLPKVGKAQGNVLRLSPTTWLVEGEAAAIEAALGDGGALTPTGGGYERVRLSGPAWRSLLMEGSLFDAESAQFAIDCVATTPIDHVAVTLRVESENACLAYVPASHAADLQHFWRLSAGGLPQS